MAPRFRPVPSNSVLTSGFGPRWGTHHRGADYGREGGSAGMAVYAAQGGTVVYAGAASGFGGPDPAGWVVIDHPTADGSGTTVYGHIIREVSVGQRVEAGHRIGRVNPSSATNGGVAPHLHFEVHPTVWAQGSQIDPERWLAGAPHPNDSRVDPVVTVPPGVVMGVDVSEFQDGMSLKKAAAEGMAFAIIRTTDGTYRDRVYASHYDDAKAAGLEIAAYHYLRNPSEGTTVAQQVQASVEVMGDRRAPVWLDVETPAGVDVEHIRQAKREYEAHGVRVIGAYSYVPYWEGQITPGEPDSHEFGAFWVAAYGTNPAGPPARIYPGNDHRQWDYPLGNQRPVLWQFGSRGAVAGFLVDVNAFRGTRDQLRALFYGEPVEDVKPIVVPPDPVTEPPVTAEPSTPLPEENRPPEPPPAAPPAPTPQPGTPGNGRRTVLDLILDVLVTAIVGRRPR